MVKIHAQLQNSYGEHLVTLTTNDNAHPIVIAPKASGSALALMEENCCSWHWPRAIATTSTVKPPSEE